MSVLMATSGVPNTEPMFMVDEATYNLTDAALNQVAVSTGGLAGDLEPGAMVYTAGFKSVKQKALDGSWVEL